MAVNHGLASGASLSARTAGEYPHGGNTARDDRHSARRPAQTYGAHNQIVAAETPRRQ
jgi:hypothetical protein